MSPAQELAPVTTQADHHCTASMGRKAGIVTVGSREVRLYDH